MLSWLAGLDRFVNAVAPSWLLSLALLTVASILALIAWKGRSSLKASALAWAVAP